MDRDIIIHCEASTCGAVLCAFSGIKCTVASLFPAWNCASSLFRQAHRPYRTFPIGAVAGARDDEPAAGIALKSLDDLVRSAPVWAGCWRSRLALKRAAAAVRLMGRREDEPCCAMRCCSPPQRAILARPEKMHLATKIQDRWRSEASIGLPCWNCETGTNHFGPLSLRIGQTKSTALLSGRCLCNVSAVAASP